jgi:hypothetical protein
MMGNFHFPLRIFSASRMGRSDLVQASSVSFFIADEDFPFGKCFPRGKFEFFGE